ncbi:MAG TPA: O-antigen ligase family protein, partial [Candidatus Methylomirabilis sp.]
WMLAVERWATSNPSIAAGSDQLYLGHRFVGIPRVRGPACEPLYFGSYLLAIAPVTAAAAWGSRGWSRLWRWITVGLAALALVLTFSRGVYGAAVVVLLLLVWGLWRGRLPRPRLRVAGAGVVAMAVAVLVAASVFTGTEPWALPRLLADRVAQSFVGHDMSNLTRLYSWSVAVDLARQAPWSGVGWGGYGFHFFELAGPEATGAHFGWPVPNNLPLQIMAETGIPGLLLWGFALWPAVRSLVRRDPQVSAAEDAGRFLLAALVVGMGVQAMTHSQLQLPHLWLVTGISSALASSRFPLV